MDSKYVRWFSSALSPDDLKTFDLVVGDPAGQQVWESLATLAALRAWLPAWQKHRISVRVRGDNVTMLRLALCMRPSGWRLAIIAREMALDVSAGTYTPSVAVHTPGIANVAADALSRKFMDKSFIMPSCLVGVQETLLPNRGEEFYLARAAPMRISRSVSQAKSVCLVANAFVNDDVHQPIQKSATKSNSASPGNCLHVLDIKTCSRPVCYRPDPNPVLTYSL